jgi:hypothetical protein
MHVITIAILPHPLPLNCRCFFLPNLCPLDQSRSDFPRDESRLHPVGRKRSPCSLITRNQESICDAQSQATGWSHLDRLGRLISSHLSPPSDCAHPRPLTKVMKTTKGAPPSAVVTRRASIKPLPAPVEGSPRIPRPCRCAWNTQRIDYLTR